MSFQHAKVGSFQMHSIEGIQYEDAQSNVHKLMSP